ncbi:MurR/RpiR family transcriptional regulator [Pseudonocardia sp. TRM90224]|uniref:MurR/RpiR family transcriptional regulator n=1 Tax=Pseudonocardia sp. TRM90224 TaxID=2812678 RepID=UPI001E3EB983|nr:MurR/RpiR family transcriptional regulator [Pseudonocardia sp. TRM90224]
MAQLSLSERKVARTFLGGYPASGLESAADLARRSEVSTPTVLRFVTRLGYTGYPDFQRALIHEVQERMSTPVAPSATHTADAIPAHEIGRTVDLLADGRRRIRLAGGRFSQVLAEYLTTRLQVVRGDVTCLGYGGLCRASAALDACRRDVFVVIDVRGYEETTIQLATTADAAGAPVVLVTDQFLSPIADFADVVLPARIETPSAFISLVPVMAVVESLAVGVAERLGDAAAARTARFAAPAARG